MLLSHTLAVHADLPVETETVLGFIPGDSLTDLQHRRKLIKCQMLHLRSQVASPGASDTEQQNAEFGLKVYLSFPSLETVQKYKTSLMLNFCFSKQKFKAKTKPSSLK